MTTGERIKQRRKEIGMSAETLAEKIGVSRATMFRYEKGAIEKMPINVLVPIARALRTTVGYLMGWEDNTPATGGDGREIEAMRFFESLPENRQAEALNYLRYLAASEDKK